MNPNKLADKTFRSWLPLISDAALLAEWGELVRMRIQQINDAATLSPEELHENLRKTRGGERLFLLKRVRDAENKLRREIVFLHYQPRAKRLWYRFPEEADPPGRRLTPDNSRWLNFRAICFHQPARTQIAVRQRATQLKQERHWK